MRTQRWAIMLMIFSTLAIATAQIIFKTGLIQENYLITILFVIAGIVFYGLGAFQVSMALKGGDLSILFPFVSLSYVFVTIGSRIFFYEPITTIKLAGIVVIIAGVSLIGQGGGCK
jgi:undecaprenyl phosphate-alpha-L-ara4N flippase subunit ArnE